MFQKGVSGNPGGRPALPEELKVKLKEGAESAVKFWITTLADESASWLHRNKSAENIVAYAYGKPKELVDLDVSGKVEGFTINIVKKLDEPAGD
jgi:hypothetical protein